MTGLAEPPVAGERRVPLRVEVQVLRAVAVLGVVLNHLWPRIFHGGYIGVDIFFVISGYLISGQLLHELRTTKRIGILRFWARRARRLLPASMLVLVVATIGTVLLLPKPMWEEVMRQIVSSALYFQNWTLAHNATDYFRSAQSPSPVTHYWSLSLEEQFYLGWPLLAWLAYTLFRVVRRPRAGVFLAFTAVAVASYVVSIHLTRTDPHAAYFATQTRIWELAVGGVLAHFPVQRWLRLPVAAIGWVAILGSMYFLTETTPIPGAVAIVPVLGTALVIWCGDGFPGLVPRFVRLARGVSLQLGRISYSLYLWHWPLIVLVPYATGHPLTDWEKGDVLLASLGIAWISTGLVEDRVRTASWLNRGSPLRSLAPGAIAMAGVVVLASSFTQQVDTQVSRATATVNAAASSPAPCFGARAIANGCANPHYLRYRDSALLTSQSYSDRLHGGSECMQDQDKAGVVSCSFGVPPAAATHRIALVGDSHARHWAPALDQLAIEHNWNVVLISKGSCPLDTAPVTTTRYPEDAASCHQWVRAVMDRLEHDRSIDVVVTSSSSRRYLVQGAAPGHNRAPLKTGFRSAWSQLARTGKAVVVIGDVPAMNQGDLPTCVARAKTRTDPCWVARGAALTPDPMLQAAAESTSKRVFSVSLNRFFCDRSRCHSVIGGVVAWADENHIIGYFARTLAPYLDPAMQRAIVSLRER
ncbi:SGNH hydrolase domain-containing protein [Nocardioides maradonensis]